MVAVQRAGCVMRLFREMRDAAPMKSVQPRPNRAIALVQALAVAIACVTVPLTHVSGSWWPLVIGASAIVFLCGTARRWVPGGRHQRR